MHNRLRLLMAATALLYLGPLLAGLAGFGWGLVPVFGSIFIVWLIVLRPQNWPNHFVDWGKAQAWATLATNAAVQFLLVILLFGVGRGIGGALGFVAPFSAIFPIIVSASSIPLCRLIWNPKEATDLDHFLDNAIQKVAHVHNPVDQSDMNLAYRMLAQLAALPDTTDIETVAEHLIVLAEHVENAHTRAVLLERQHSGNATRAETIALILHATDGALIESVGGDGPTLALAILPPDPDLIALFAGRLATALDADPELWGQCPTVERLQDLADQLNDTAAEAPLRALIAATNRAQPEDGLA